MFANMLWLVFGHQQMQIFWRPRYRQASMIFCGQWLKWSIYERSESYTTTIRCFLSSVLWELSHKDHINTFTLLNWQHANRASLQSLLNPDLYSLHLKSVPWPSDLRRSVETRPFSSRILSSVKSSELYLVTDWKTSCWRVTRKNEILILLRIINFNTNHQEFVMYSTIKWDAYATGTHTHWSTSEVHFWVVFPS